MKLKALYKDQAEIPEGFGDLYEQTDDGWVLTGVEDSEFKSKISEFRTNNINLQKRAQSLEAAKKEIEEKFSGLDPEKAKKALEALEKLEQDEEKKLVEEGNLDEVVQRRIGAMKADYERQLQAKGQALSESHEAIETLKSRLGKLLIEQEVQIAIGAAGVKVRPGALPDVLSRARESWTIDEAGKAVAHDSKGGKVYGREGEPLTMTEYAQSLVDNASHLFEGGKGGGGGGSGEKGATQHVRGMSAEDFGKHIDKIASGKMKVTVGE